MNSAVQDIRFAFRQMRRSPGFAATAVLTLALGIAANIIVFGVLQALVLRPLDVPHADRVVTLQRGPNAITRLLRNSTGVGDSDGRLFGSQRNVASFRSVLLKCQRQAGISEYVCDSFEVVGHDTETEFCVSPCSSTQKQPWMTEDSVLYGCERVFND